MPKDKLSSLASEILSMENMSTQTIQDWGERQEE